MTGPLRTTAEVDIEPPSVVADLFTEVDVVRHPLVARIVVAYDRRDQALARARERSVPQRPTRSPVSAAGGSSAEGEDRE